MKDSGYVYVVASKSPAKVVASASEVKINQAQLKELLIYNRKTGIFTWAVNVGLWGRIKIGTVAGVIQTNGYNQINIKGKRYLSHRLAWLYEYGCFPVEHIDHINHNRTDNSILNLRSVSNSDNQKNKSMPSNNTSGTVGVYWEKSGCKWRAQIKVNGKIMYLGSFDSMDNAIHARKEANIKYGFHENHGNKTNQ